MSGCDSSLLKQLLPNYYKLIFPFKPYMKWLCYNKKPEDYFAKREFAFIFDEDVHLRYRSFDSQSEFEKELCKNNPHKLDIGALYNHKPKDNKKHSDFKAVERELVFDVDLTDYDNVRRCCSDAKVCEKCWRFISIAVQVLDKLLEEDFGFKARLWVFSGRRGVHCWVSDEKARKLTNVGRAAIVEYLSLIVGDKLDLYGSRLSKSKKLLLVHPMIETAYRIIMNCGELDKMVLEQGWLDFDSALSILKYCEDPELRSTLLSQFEEVDSPDKRWQLLKRRFDEKYRMEMTCANHVIPMAVSKSGKDFLRWFVLWHTYPRLDVSVSTGLNHLLKSPFCVHPKTGSIAVPLDVSKISDFNVLSCPRIDVLINELSRVLAEKHVKKNRKILGYKHTSLAPYVEIFEKFVEIATLV
ncbi:putative DNA primase, eukaryotic-type, small subunit [Dictyocaulus viviparus]|uniref:DNA primase n=1 Tax=Dictyocaulus viviparus TaxID=29172 RepID=A0A0D8XLU4_DICVI|nr:putative DNA primase, eukaryotic-type, small subunit [Dictyocaulus viviparus]